MPASARHRFRRRGVTSVIAMAFLVIFVVMALGFYGQVDTNVQIARNETQLAGARIAAESGLAFIRYQLAGVAVHGGDTMMDELYLALKSEMEYTGNLPNGQQITRNATNIYIPEIDLVNGGGKFSARIYRAGYSTCTVNVTATYAQAAASAAPGTTASCRMSFLLRPRRSTALDFGVVSRSAMRLDSNAAVTGVGDPGMGRVLIMSDASPSLDLASNSQVTGQVWFTDGTPSFTKSGTSKINGTTTPVLNTVYVAGAPPPEIPLVDTSMFLPYATHVLSTVNGKYDTVNLRNVLIKANTNPTLGGSITVEGVIYIETPNKVTFDSNTRVRGVIVVQNNPTGSPVSNVIDFRSNSSFLGGVETLNSTFPVSLKALSGSAILAPNFTVNFNSNFGIAGGSIIASKVNFDANSA